MSDETFCFIGIEPGKIGACCAVADMPKFKSDTDKTIAEWVRDGLTVERVTTQVARDELGKYFTNKKEDA